MEIYNFISLFGVICLVGLAYLFSTDRKAVNWHIVIWGFGLQLLFAWFLFVFPAGTKVFLWLNQAVLQLMSAAMAGVKFLFGPLGLTPGEVSPDGQSSIGFILAIQALPTIIFFSALMSILYYFNIIPRLIRWFAYLFTRLMKVSGAEALCTASNIFVGVESALTVKPYLAKMTKSELCTVLTAGMATVSSNILALYVFSLQDVFPNIAGHLISASLLSAPAALMMSKVLLPESQIPQTLGENVQLTIDKKETLFETLIDGANTGVKLIVGIAALLIAVLGLVALTDQGLALISSKLLTALPFELSLSNILGVVFYPLMIVCGIPIVDVATIAPLIAERLVLTEVASYQHLAVVMSEATLVHPRSAFIAAYMLCGFAHFASMAIFVGGISAIVPNQQKALAQVALRSLVAATLACLMTGCIAGVFFSDNTLLL